jgi:acetolactate synthase-1/2/3 large subunit
VNVAQVTAEILKREGVEYLLAYPLNPLIEAAAAVDIRPIIVRQERAGVHMADAISRMSSGDSVGVFCMQSGPGIENSFGAVAQAYAEAVPLIVIAGAPARAHLFVKPNFNSSLNFQHVTKAVETITTAEMIVAALRRAFTQARNGRPGPVVIEVPSDVWNEEVPGPIEYVATRRFRSAPDPASVDAAAAALIAAERPLIYAGQGIHYAKAWSELLEVVELLEAPITTSLEGKSSFPETHPLSLGSGGVAMNRAVFDHVTDADVIFGAGASFSATPFGIHFPTANKTFVHNTNEAADINKNIATDHPVLGDSKLALGMLRDALKDRLGNKPRGRLAATTKLVKEQTDTWRSKWMHLLTSDAKPMSPYRVIWDFLHTTDVANTIITHDAGSPRDELSPFWITTAPLSYIGWGKSTQLGYGLPLVMGAKLAHPEKLCVNVWGDAAIGMTGMDFETCVRCNIPILSILFNNYSMAMEFKVMALSRAKYKSTDISGNYSDWAKALGGYGERITEPSDIINALKRGIAATQEGRPALLEFITTDEKIYSTHTRGYQG